MEKWFNFSKICFGSDILCAQCSIKECEKNLKRNLMCSHSSNKNKTRFMIYDQQYKWQNLWVYVCSLLRFSWKYRCSNNDVQSPYQINSNRFEWMCLHSFPFATNFIYWPLPYIFIRFCLLVCVSVWVCVNAFLPQFSLYTPRIISKHTGSFFAWEWSYLFYRGKP